MTQGDLDKDKAKTSKNGKPPAPSCEPQIIWPVGGPSADGAARDHRRAPDVRFLHFNDVYHVDQASSEPVGGLSRFMTLCREYREGKAHDGQPKPVAIFSGDAFDPSTESAVTKGRHMVNVLNAIGTDAACVGNHDLDFGVDQFEYLSQRCQFPWLLANMLDPALGKDVPIGHAGRTHMVTTSNGIKIGLIGLGEREWLDTVASLPPNIIFLPASDVVKELVPQLRAQGAEMIVCINHMREPNDNALADATGGDLVDIILGGHDHYYNHTYRNGTHVLRSGTDFKQLSYIEARRVDGGGGGGGGGCSDARARWEFDIVRRDVTSQVPEDPPTVKLVSDLTSKLHESFEMPLGFTAVAIDARSDTTRGKESNMGNFVADVVRAFQSSDCALISGGMIRGDQIYPPGVIRLKDILRCFPFEDPIVQLRASGQAIFEAIENGVSLYPKREGRFPQVSGIRYAFDPARQPGHRVTHFEIGDKPFDPKKLYTVSTTGYVGNGKDGYKSMLVKSQGGQVEEVIDEEHGLIASTILRQYFMALRTVGQWSRLSARWLAVAESSRQTQLPARDLPASSAVSHLGLYDDKQRHDKNGRGDRGDQDAGKEDAWLAFHRQRIGIGQRPLEDSDEHDDCAFDPTVNPPARPADGMHAAHGNGSGGKDGSRAAGRPRTMDEELYLMRKYFDRWARTAGVEKGRCVADPMTREESTVDWTRTICPVNDGRIVIVGA